MVFNHWDKKQNLKIIEDFKAFSNSNPIQEAVATANKDGKFGNLMVHLNRKMIPFKQTWQTTIPFTDDYQGICKQMTHLTYSAREENSIQYTEHNKWILHHKIFIKLS